MKRTRLRSFMLIIGLIAATGATMAYSSGAGKTWLSDWITSGDTGPAPVSGPLTLTGRLVQNKVLQGSDGRVHLALTLQAADRLGSDSIEPRSADLVIVLDRSGSMKGLKLNNARRAVLSLLARLSAKDRLALVTYSDGVQYVSDLNPVTAGYREQLAAQIGGVIAGGGTNLGAGLQTGINILLSAPANGNARKLILISDGLANKGIVDSARLGAMAGVAVENELAVSTVGVGNDFNELLMTAIADRGAGNYYYLENPTAFAEVFQKEFFYAQTTVATNVSVSFLLDSGISLLDAAGYPISVQNNHAVFYPGNLRAGQTRKFFLTLQVPTASAGSFKIGEIFSRYRFNGRPMQTALDGSYEIACVQNKAEVRASIDKTSWTEKVIREDYNHLKQEIAADIKAGKRQNALKRIHSYYREQTAINEAVKSAKVTQNLNRDLKDLEQTVEETFKGAPSAVARQQKSNSKALQYEGYQGRR